MKLSYSNWHKELVHDDAIRSELDQITGGQLEFSNTPYIKHRNQPFERDDYPARSGGRWKQNFGGRNNRNQGGGQQQRNDPRNGGGQRNDRNQGGGQRNDPRNGGGSNRNDRNPGGFKKRY